MKTSRWFAPTPERTQAVIHDITDGSEPKISYYALLVTAAMIACFGLVTNSTAVIIGAMLVSLRERIKSLPDFFAIQEQREFHSIRWSAT